MRLPDQSRVPAHRRRRQIHRRQVGRTTPVAGATTFKRGCAAGGDFAGGHDHSPGELVRRSSLEEPTIGGDLAHGICQCLPVACRGDNAQRIPVVAELGEGHPAGTGSEERVALVDSVPYPRRRVERAKGGRNGGGWRRSSPHATVPLIPYAPRLAPRRWGRCSPACSPDGNRKDANNLDKASDC